MQSEERSRKLREDLAVEEHRGQELDRILREILPDPKSSAIRRSRRERRVGYLALHLLLLDVYCLGDSYTLMII